MNEHVTAWLDAYQDGELRPSQRRKVEAHLAECSACREELATRQALSAWLRDLPADLPLTPSERFTAQVMLRLPARRTPAASTPPNLLPWALPLILLLAWGLLQAISILNAWLQLGVSSGWLSHLLPGLRPAGSNSLWVGLLSALGGAAPAPGLQPVLHWLLQADRWLGDWLGVLTWQGRIIFLYWLWLAFCLLRHPRTPSVPSKTNGTLLA